MWRGPIVGTTGRMGCGVLCGKLLFNGFSAVAADNGNEWEEWSVMAVKSSGQHRMWAAADKFFERLIHDFSTVELARPIPWLKNKKSFCIGSQTAAHFDIIIMLHKSKSQSSRKSNRMVWIIHFPHCSNIVIVAVLMNVESLSLKFRIKKLFFYPVRHHRGTEASCYLHHAYMMQM